MPRWVAVIVRPPEAAKTVMFPASSNVAAWARHRSFGCPSAELLLNRRPVDPYVFPADQPVPELEHVQDRTCRMLGISVDTVTVQRRKRDWAFEVTRSAGRSNCPSETLETG